MHDYTNIFSSFACRHPSGNNTPVSISRSIICVSVSKFSSPVKETKGLGEMTDYRSILSYTKNIFFVLEERPWSKNNRYHHAIMSKGHRIQFKVVSAVKSEKIGTSK